MSGPLLLSIESSCDETGVAVIDGGRRILSNVVASQVALHAPTGGIVPELAARAHLRWIVPSLDEAWTAAGVDWRDIDGIAVTYGPGLAGSLLVGINFAKALSWVHDVPLIGVNHLEGHLYAAWLLDPGEDEATKRAPILPLVATIVSGGHTFIAEVTDHLTYRLLGTTVDDAAGEAFDKVGRLLGLGYPGGPAIQKAAEGAVRRDVRFPRAWMGDSYDLSFSGLKTAARRIVADARAERAGPLRAGGQRRPSLPSRPGHGAHAQLDVGAGHRPACLSEAPPDLGHLLAGERRRVRGRGVAPGRDYANGAGQSHAPTDEKCGSVHVLPQRP